jgi:hypothetical protein
MTGAHVRVNGYFSHGKVVATDTTKRASLVKAPLVILRAPLASVPVSFAPSVKLPASQETPSE